MIVRITNYAPKFSRSSFFQQEGVFADVAQGYGRIDHGRPGIDGAPSSDVTPTGSAGEIHAEGKEYPLAANNGKHLHGGEKGSRFQVFSARQLSPASVEMVYVFKDGEEEVSGDWSVLSTASPTSNEFVTEWSAVAQDRATVANFAGHTFLNLSGNGDDGLTSSRSTPTSAGR